MLINVLICLVVGIFVATAIYLFCVESRDKLGWTLYYKERDYSARLEEENKTLLEKYEECSKKNILP